MDIDTIWKQYAILRPDENDDDTNSVTNPICRGCKMKTICEDVINGTVVCTNCGIVNDDFMIDNRAEWNFNSGDDGSNKKDPARCGCPINPLLAKSSMSTIIHSKRHHFMKRLHNQMSMDYVERSRYHVFESIAKMGGEIGQLSPAIIDQAKYYYKILSERKLSRGVIRKGLIACCVMYACKSMNVPRSIKEISIMTNVPVPVLNKTTKLFMKTMCDVLQSNTTNVSGMIESTDSRHLIHRYCNLLQIEDKREELALVREVKKIDRDLKEHGVLDCKTPTAITTGIIIYAAHSLNITLSKVTIANIFGISIVTINKIVKMISEYYK